MSERSERSSAEGRAQAPPEAEAGAPAPAQRAERAVPDPNGRGWLRDPTTGIQIGDLVRLVPLRGHVQKALAGRLVAVRAFGQRDPDHAFRDKDRAVRVDDGDPSNPDPLKNGFHFSAWLPMAAIVPLRTP